MNDLEFRIFIDRIKDSVDIVDIINERYPLKNHKALCPFHQETKPSFSVNQREQYFYCFGCGKGGDVLAFLMEYDGLTFWDALQILAQRAGVSIPDSKVDLKQIEKKRKIEDVLNETVKFYASHIPPDVKGYLINQRGLTDETILKYRIGYANWNLKEHLIEKCKFDIDLCVESGVIKNKEDGEVNDFFYKRIILPTMWRGRVVYLSGRAHGDHQPKYLHLPGEKKYFYNEESLSEKELHVTEGIFDCLSMIQNGYPCVAIQGKNLKEGDEEKFSRCEKVYLCLDSDDGGKEGSLDIAGKLGLKAKILQIPEGTDPNKYFLTHSNDDFDNLKSSALDYFGYQINLIPAGISRIELTEKLKPILLDLAPMDEPYIEAVLKDYLKVHFGLTAKEIDGYRSLIKKIKKEESAKSESESEQHQNREITAKFDRLVDIVEGDGGTYFLIKQDDELLVEKEYEIDGVFYVPPTQSQIPWLVPRANKVLENYENYKKFSESEILSMLYDEIIKYLKIASELPSDEYYDLLTAWIFHTYHQERFHYTPIICFFSVPERGKSRTGKALIYLAYHGIHLENLKEQHIFRFSERFNASIFLDVMDLWKKVERYGSEDIILGRFEKGAMVPRVPNPDRKPFEDMVYYKISGPTIIATNEPVNHILETRSITISMPQTSRRFENDIKPEISRPLREKLIAFRARFLDRPFEDIKKPSNGRLGDILKPIVQIIRLVKPQKEKEILILIRKIKEDLKVEKSETVEAEILRTVFVLKSNVVREYLPVKLITDTINRNRSENSKITWQLVGRRLKAMGFTKKRLGDGASGIFWDEELIYKNMESMGVEKTSEMSETSVKDGNNNIQSDITDVSEVSPNGKKVFFDDIHDSNLINWSGFDA